MEDVVKSIISETLEVPVAEITEASSMETIDTWDSLRHMELVVAIERRFNVEFDAEEALVMTDFGRIQRMLAAKMAKA